MEMKHLEQHLLRNHFKNLVAEKTEKCSQLEKEKIKKWIVNMITHLREGGNQV